MTKVKRYDATYYDHIDGDFEHAGGSWSTSGRVVLDADASLLEAAIERKDAALRRIRDKYIETQKIMREHGWKYDNPEDLQQKMAFSIYTDLVECCDIARAALEET